MLAHVLTTLNNRHKYGLDLFLLSIDEGISGYRDDSLETVKRNEQQYGIPLKILSYQELYGWTMDEIVRAIGHKNNCTFCGVFRRQALDRGAALMKADKMATGAYQQAISLLTLHACMHCSSATRNALPVSLLSVGHIAAHQLYQLNQPVCNLCAGGKPTLSVLMCRSQRGRHCRDCAAEHSEGGCAAAGALRQHHNRRGLSTAACEALQVHL